jgi:hypothetical protein
VHAWASPQEVEAEGGLEAAVKPEVSKWGQALGVVGVGAQPEPEQEVERVVEHLPGRAGRQASPWLRFQPRV